MNERTTVLKEASSSAKEQAGSESQTSSNSALYQRALSFHRRTLLDEAEVLYRQILKTEPNHHGALHFLGLIALVRGDTSESLSYIEQAINWCSTNAVYYNNYGVALKKVERNQDAQRAFERAIALNPNYADAWSNLGQILFLLKEKHRVIEFALNKALKLVPEHPDALSHLAQLRYAQERYSECAEILKKLLPRRPDDVTLLNSIAESFAQARDYGNAIAFLLQALPIQPDNIDILHRLGTYYGELGEIPRAKKYFLAASAVHKKETPWRWKLLGYCPVFFDSVQQIEDYWQQLHRELDEALAEERIYDWKTLVYDGFTSSFHLPHHNKCCREVKEKFVRLFEKSFPFERPPLKNSTRKSGKIRIGFLVTAGHEGGFLRYTSEIIRRLDAKKFEVFVFYHELSEEKFKAIPPQDNVSLVPFDWNFERTVAKIKETECDIMYFWKVGADVWNFFLPMCRLAPIQFTSWGTHGTSGLKHIDYSLSYRLAEAENAQEHYTEKLFLIEEAPAFQPRMHLPHRLSKDELRLPSSGAVYFCPHRLSKYHPKYDFYLKGILENDPNGHILLLLGDVPSLSEKFKERMRRNIGDAFFCRMIFIPSQPPQLYNQLLAASTMILDSHIYSGGITAYDALSYGVPCVTQAGPLHVQRYPLSSYRAMGIADAPVAANREEYVNAAVKVGTDSDYRKHLSEQIIERGDSVFEREGVVRKFERFFEAIISETI